MNIESQSKKKFINNRNDVVNEALDGLCLFNSQIVRIKNTQIITLKNQVQNKVTLICGGGSGHEPAHGGFVDEKIIQAAVCGGVFASPSYQEVQQAIEHVATNQGVLVIIKNYTGDVINFELAAGFARTKGLFVKTLIVGDDISFVENQNDIQQIKQARGLSGTCLLYKILGAAAYLGKSLDYVHSFGETVLKNTFTLGVSMSSCSIPGFQPNFELASNEIEIGLGIHGEKGRGRKQVENCDQIIEDMLKKFDSFIQSGDEVVVLLNNLGSCTDLEMCIISRAVYQKLLNRGIKTIRAIEGRIMTSLEMQGILITIYKIDNQTKQEFLQYLDLPVDSKHWRTQTINENIYVESKSQPKQYFDKTKTIQQSSEEGQYIFSSLKFLFEKLSLQENYFNKLDSEVGDGDTGSGVFRACQESLKYLHCLDFSNNIKESVIALAELIAQSFAGSSGPLYGSFLTNASMKLKNSGNQIQDYASAFSAGVDGIVQLGKCSVGDRTMYDVLFYVNKLFQDISQQALSSKQIILQLQDEAKRSSEEASKLRAKKGRSRYLDGNEIGKKDPGCELVVTWLSLLSEVINA